MGTPRVVLVAHEPLASAWRDCAEHVLGHKPNVECVDVPADVDTEAMCQQLLERFSNMNDPNAHEHGFLLLCDVFGATPFNIARRVVRQLNREGERAALLTGTNLCMVLKSLTTTDIDLRSLASRVAEAGRKGVVDVCEGLAVMGPSSS
ncbi:PTS sugar transporter subunit IIA [Pusillimonas sp. CC-YST705]|uniref:PTS sugar transporter subunit IIA n=1 Tax=Mesopusillimonas faecipullorum TaxID=2755040 RepID=A0ABS8CBE5_9BURK|nr:PTS sugar transporter subunit IIA [Mesopusillimonas faecipullorum]MCB5363352.1 PTS sugar transporter subunit IIA [Mesopusillimonas faecipullorum]